MRLLQLYLCILVYICASMQALTCMHVLIVCDENITQICQDLKNSDAPFPLIDVNDSQLLNISVATDVVNVKNGFKILRERVEEKNTSFIIVFGSSFVVNMASIVAKHFGITVLQYSTSKQRKAMFPEQTVVFNPTMLELSKAVITLVGKNMMDNAYIVCLDSLLHDGFFDEGISGKISLSEQQRITVSEEDSDYDLTLKLVTIHDSGFRLIIMHTTAHFFQRFVALGSQIDLFDSGFAWILTERIFSPPAASYNMPCGLLAIEGFEENNYDAILRYMVSSVVDVADTLDKAGLLDSNFVPLGTAHGVTTDYLVRSLEGRIASGWLYWPSASSRANTAILRPIRLTLVLESVFIANLTNGNDLNDVLRLPPCKT